MKAPASARGAALILVLWMVVLLTASIGAFALSAGTARLQESAFRQQFVAREAARAGVEYAVLRLTHPDPGSRWTPDGVVHEWTFGGATLELRIEPESARTDLNGTDAIRLAGLFEAAGVDPAVSARLAGAIVDWRDPDPLTQPGGGAEDADYAFAGMPYGAKDAPFEDVAEVRQVFGMTPELYALVAPRLTVYGGAGTYSIRSRARLGNGRVATLRVVVRANAGGVPGPASTSLRWEEGEVPG